MMAPPAADAGPYEGPTPYPDLNDVLREFVGGARSILGDDLVAACLQGSFAVGDFDEHSDCDWVMAIARPLTDDQVAALQEDFHRVYDLPCAWAQHLEGSYFPVDVLLSCDRRGEKLWYLDNGAREMTRSAHCNSAVVRQQVREHGVRLYGADPRSLVDPIPVDVLREEIQSVIVDWGGEILADPGKWANRFYQGFITLSFCRKWCDLTLGTVGSKRRGAAWAKERLAPEWHDLIDRAWKTRPVPEVSVQAPADPEDWKRTLRLVALVIEAVSGQT
jgi:predicted nucleotidyltransferase